MSAAARVLLFATILLIAALTFAGFSLWRTGDRVEAMQQQLVSNQATLDNLLGEVTRMRIEQSTTGKGPRALLERLQTFAPLLANSRTTDPDFQNAKKEMTATLRAFESVGQDAWALITARLEQTKPDHDFDEVKWLLEAALRIDARAAEEILKQVLLGTRMPSPRLRWYAAQRLTETNKSLAQVLLRQIVMTESSFGVNPGRNAIGETVPDPAAMSTSGFHNFIVHYARTEDPKLEDTLMMVIGRAENDRMTVQESVKVLGDRRCERAVASIKKIYQNPPLRQFDPLFLINMLDAIVSIEDKKARPWLEQMLPTAVTEQVANHIKFLLDKIK